MKTCPVCHQPPMDISSTEPERMGTLRWFCATRDCVLLGHEFEDDAWSALPRVAPNAEALVDDLVSAACARRYCEAGDTQDVMRARAALLRACVVDAAEVAALRVQRDEAVAEAARLCAKPTCCSHCHDEPDAVSPCPCNHAPCIHDRNARIKEIEAQRATGVPEAGLLATRGDK